MLAIQSCRKGRLGRLLKSDKPIIGVVSSLYFAVTVPSVVSGQELTASIALKSSLELALGQHYSLESANLIVIQELLASMNPNHLVLATLFLLASLGSKLSQSLQELLVILNRQQEEEVYLRFSLPLRLL